MSTDQMALLNLVAVVTLVGGLFGGAFLCASGHFWIGVPIGLLCPLSWVFIRVNCDVIKDIEKRKKRGQ